MDSKITIMILYRGDTIQRLENVVEIIRILSSFSNVVVYIREATNYNNKIIQSSVKSFTNYEFVIDRDPILHKTKHFNEMLRNITTEFVGIWDTDVIAYKESFLECFEKLKKGEVTLALPYNGVCLDTSSIIRQVYLQKQKFDILVDNMQKMKRLQPYVLTGGAVLMHTETFRLLGGENENYYGWGDDDYDRYIRFMNNGYAIYRSKNVLFHLTHPRSYNSNYNSRLHQQISKAELLKTIYEKG